MAGATPLGNMVIKLGLDDADFGRGVANSKKQVTYLAKEMQANMKIADLAGNKLGKLGTRYDSLTQIIKAQENQVSSLKKAYDESFVDGKATDSTKRLATQLQDANGKLANYKTQLSQTAGQLARLKVETQGVTGWMNQHADAYIKQGEAIAKFGSKVSSVGSTLTKAITLPVAAGFTFATKAASDFTTQIGEIGPLLTNGQAITAEYKQQLEQMGESSKQWAKDYGVSTTEINQGLAEVVRKGYDANQTMGVMPAILDATKASGDAFNDVMNVTTEVISQFGLKGKDYATTVQNATRVTDSLTYVANATSAGFTDLGLAMSYVGPVANSLNMSVEETAAAIGLLNDAGIGGEKAGTALRGALTSLLKPSDQNIAGFEQLGISVDAFKEGTLTLPDILDKIKTNTQGWTDAQRTSAIALAFGTESQSAMNVLVNQGGDALRNLTSETESASGATKKIADSMKDLPANKVARFKESLNVLAITFGEKLLPLVTPWIEKATDMVNSFSELDDATQNNIVKWGLMAAAAGPALKLLGGGISTIGSVTKGVGKLSTGIVKLVASAAEKKAIAGLATSITGVGTAATTAVGTGTAGAAAGGLAGMGTAIAGLAGPIAIGVVALGAIAGAVYLGKKAYDEHQLAGAKWGTAVTKEQDKVISKSYELRDKAVSYVNEYADGVRGSADKAIKANNDIVTSIENTLKKDRERDEKAAQSLYNEAAQKRAQDYLEGQKALDEENVALATKTTNRINEILKSASDNNRQLSDEERQYIAANYNRLSDAQLKAAGFTKNQRIAIESAYQTDLSKLTTKELQTRAENVMSSLDKEQSSYEKQKTKLAEIYGKGTENYKAELAKLDEANQQSNASMILGLAKLTLQQGFSLDQMSGAWEKYGWTTEEVQALVTSSAASTSKNVDMLAKATNEAGIAWNQLALDPKTGEVKTNMADTLVEMAKTDDGWKQLQFMAKNADISTNAKEEIAIAMGEADKWQFLTIEDKKLLVNGDEAQIALYDTIDKMGLWNQYNVDRKTLGIDNADAAWKLAESNNMLAQWNGLPVEQKTMLADNQDLLNKVLSSQENYNAWIALPDNLKKMLGDNSDIVAKLTSGEIALDEYARNNPALKQLLGDAVNIQAATSAGNQSLDGYAGNNPAAKALNGNSSGVQNASKTGEDALNKFNQNNPAAKALNAADNASGPAGRATSAVREFAQQKDHKVTLTSVVKNVTQWITEKFTKNEKGTNYHPGGLAMVNDQKGPLYKELVQYPNGELFMPNGRNVMLDLPRGTKVVKASQTRNLMVRAGIPNYAQGVGIPRDSELVRNLESVSGNNNTSKVIVNSNNEATERKLDQLIAIMSQFGNDLKNLKLEANGKNLAEVVENERNFRASMIAKARG
ncbi:phage tail tape measure protein [Enterococcus italicus]|uniref:phage tail tape measure protein n=1 Tax=Enterococcus italicus TaxID=246144 RepID=UPI002073D43B|nr:phage tail tape measure protein [Enterococcus italicus]